MNKLLEDYLVKKYPKILKDVGGDPKVTCMAWGVAVNDGWFFLLNSLLGTIQNYIDNHNNGVEKWGKELEEKAKTDSTIDKSRYTPIPQVVALQIKEKFGGLRFYTSGGNDTTEGMIAFAEALSYRICEDCGIMNELVNLNPKGWLRTTCPFCTEDKEGHLKNRDKELAEIWEKVYEEHTEKTRKLLEKGEDF